MGAGLPILLVLGFHYQQSHKLHQLSRPTVLSSKEHCFLLLLLWPHPGVGKTGRSLISALFDGLSDLLGSGALTQQVLYFHSLHWIVRYFIFKKIYIFFEKFCQVMWRFSCNSTQRGTVNKENETWFIVKALNKSLCLP